jgi:hypothetical protein
MCATSKFVTGETITEFLDDLTSKFTQSMTKGAKGKAKAAAGVGAGAGAGAGAGSGKSPMAPARAKSAWT